MKLRAFLILLISTLILISSRAAAERSRATDAWARHTLLSGNGLRGADGVRFNDVNNDGLPDCVVGWEQSNTVTISINPGPKGAREPWPVVQFDNVINPEDAVLIDVDGDGNMDVVSCCEGRGRAVYIHWAPAAREEYLDALGWKVEKIPTTMGHLWMYCVPMQVDGKHGIDLVVGSKSKIGVAWLAAPENPRNIKDWKLHRMTDAGWVMSMMDRDMDGDGDMDVLISDRRKQLRGVRWLENPGPGSHLKQKWNNHFIGANGREVMFLDVGDINGDGQPEIVTQILDQEMMIFKPLDKTGRNWENTTIPHPPNVGTGKAVTIGDVNLDGRPDLVLTFGKARGVSGCIWMENQGNDFSGPWRRHEISGPAGIKYDLVPMIDLDGDGDLDAVTTEESTNLGIIWYENPTRGRRP